jgi:hypothetical protein
MQEVEATDLFAGTIEIPRLYRIEPKTSIKIVQH